MKKQIIKKQKQKQKKTNKYYAVISKSDNFLHGVFHNSPEGLTKAKNYVRQIDSTNKNFKIIKR